MALKPRRDCKTDISTKAKTCPHCGLKRPRRSTPAECGGKAMLRMGRAPDRAGAHTALASSKENRPGRADAMDDEFKRKQGETGILRGL